MGMGSSGSCCCFGSRIGSFVASGNSVSLTSICMRSRGIYFLIACSGDRSHSQSWKHPDYQLLN